MKRLPAKISLFFLILVFISSCSSVRRLEQGQKLLSKNSIFVNSKKISDGKIYNQLYQEPNSKFLGIPFGLQIYNLARPNIDSILRKNILDKPEKMERLKNWLSSKQLQKYIQGRVQFNQWLKSAGEAPVLVNDQDAKKSANRLTSYYWNNGWFNTETDYEIVPLEEKEKRARVEYHVLTHQPYKMDSIRTQIASPVLDSLYESHKKASVIKPNSQYRTLDINAERDRLTKVFRNNGVYNFDQEFISFDADTINTNHKVNTTIIVENRLNDENDSTSAVNFKIHHIKNVNIITDYSYAQRNEKLKDSAKIGNYSIYSYEDLEYDPQQITETVFIKPGSIYSDIDRERTYSRINSLRIFKYPTIQFVPTPGDSTKNNLTANILLSPQPKYSLGFDFDVSQSNIQKFGIGFGGSLLIRNVFGGLENLELSARGSVGAANDAAASKDKNQFFDISEVGADIKLSLPRIFLPFNTEKLIPKYMSPFTTLSIGVSTQNNIGLDKQNLNGILNYQWYPSSKINNSIDLLNIQYVRNLNIDNYFNVYRNSYNDLNEIVQTTNVVTNPTYLNTEGNLTIPRGAEGFLQDIRNNEGATSGLTSEQNQTATNIGERRMRLTENNLIFATNYTYVYNTKDNLYDQQFSRFRFKIEAAGNTLYALSKLANFSKSEDGKYNVLGVNFSQYLKTEIDFIKHWDLGHQNIFAMRAFGGIAIPYGNANSIPFTRSFFAGGPNDIRAWRAYDLGPGSSGGPNEFNEANMKLTLNLEHRYNLFGSLNSAVFIDIGNIWNVADIVTDEAYTFDSLSDFKDVAVGSGFGLRYDFNFFILRFDIGFKTYNPALEEGERWFKEYNFGHAVYNVGINYPF